MDETITAIRYHDFSMGHKVTGHEDKCAHLHGHNYRVYFHVTAEELDGIGRVIDFAVIKTRLAQWLEDNYDHKFIINRDDPLAAELFKIAPDDVVLVGYNPTAENIAKYLVEVVAPKQLAGTGTRLTKCEVQETRKCGAVYEKI